MPMAAAAPLGRSHLRSRVISGDRISDLGVQIAASSDELRERLEVGRAWLGLGLGFGLGVGLGLGLGG